MIEHMHISPKVAHDQRRSALDHGESLTVAGGGCSRPEYKSWFGGHDMGECLHGEKACKALRKIFGRNTVMILSICKRMSLTSHKQH
jgi:hypothetical protein